MERLWCSGGSSDIRRYAVGCKRHLRCCLLKGNCRYMRKGVLRAARQGSSRQARSWCRSERIGTPRKSELEMKFLLKIAVQLRKMKKRWSRRRKTQLGWFVASLIARTGIAQCRRVQVARGPPNSSQTFDLGGEVGLGTVTILGCDCG